MTDVNKIPEGEVVDGDEEHDPLAPAQRFAETVNDLLPEKRAVVPLWNVSEQEMAEWSLEQYVSSGATIRAINDFSQWVIGKLALNLERHYGEDSLGEFAKEIGVSRASVNTWRWVARKYQDESEVDITMLSYSFYQVAAGTSEPMEWIMRAFNENWSVDKLKYEIKLEQGMGSDEPDGPEDAPKILKIRVPEFKKVVVINLADAPKVKANMEEYYQGEISLRTYTEDDPLNDDDEFIDGETL